MVSVKEGVWLELTNTENIYIYTQILNEVATMEDTIT